MRIESYGIEPTLKAIAARVHMADSLIEQGQGEEARALLDQLKRALPKPDKANFEAAKVKDRY